MITTANTTKALTATLSTALGLGLLLAPAAAASGSGVRSSGDCSAHAAWNLKAKHDDGRIEVEAQVDSNRAGQSWRWSIRDNGTLVRSGTATTSAPSGSFSVHRLIGNRAGTDHVVFRATRPATGQTCRGSVSL